MKKIGLYILVTVFTAALGALTATAIYSLGEVGAKTTAGVTKEHAKDVAVKAIRGNIVDEYVITDSKGRITSFGFLVKNTQDDSFEVNVDAAKGRVSKINRLQSEAVLKREIAHVG